MRKYSERELAEVKRLIQSEGRKLLMENTEIAKQRFKKVIDDNINDYLSPREKYYDIINLYKAMLHTIELVEKIPYEIIDIQTNERKIGELNQHFNDEIKKLER
jgi:hypothetical protein